MLFYVRLNNEEHRVRVESRRNRHFVSFDDGPEERVDLVYYGNDCTYVRDHCVLYANVAGAKGEYRVWFPQGILNLEVESEYRRLVKKLRGQDIENENIMLAKMPGKIVKVMTRQGAEVEKGQPVLVMEAMKMENEITASATGIVEKVHVKEGQAVEAGATLIELKSAE